MNVKRLHLSFKLPDHGETHRRQSAKTSARRNPETPHINPRVRAYGKARLDIARRVQTQQDWDALWRPPTHAFPFAFSSASSWKQCLEYRVDDFAAEIGFWIDILGLQVIAFSPDYVQFNSPGGEFTFAVSSTFEDQPSTPPWSLRIQFAVQDLTQTVEELERRSITFDQLPIPQHPDSNLYSATFSTPHGIPIDLVAESEPAPAPNGARPGPVVADRHPQETPPPSRQDDLVQVVQPASLDLYTWDDEKDQAPIPEFCPTIEEPVNPAASYNNWPVSTDIATQLTEARRSRHFSEASPAYSPETSGEDSDQDELENDLDDFDEPPASQNSPREEEYSETITYEPID
jgi:hypothetical protein